MNLNESEAQQFIRISAKFLRRQTLKAPPYSYSVSFFASFEVKVAKDHKSEYKPLILSLDLKNLFKRKISQEAVGFINSFDSSCGR